MNLTNNLKLAALTVAALTVGAQSVTPQEPPAAVKAPAPPADKPADPDVPAERKPTREDSVVAPPLKDVVIDGDLKDWPAKIARYSVSRLLPGGGNASALGFGGLGDADPEDNPDLTASFSVGYDPKAQLLYLAVVVRDDKVIIGHTSHLDTDAIEVYVDGLISETVLPYPGADAFARMDTSEFPVQQYIAIPGEGRIYGKPQETNPILMGGDLKKTKTKMAFRTKGHVTTYEWAIQVFDKYPDKPTELAPGKHIGFDIAVADRDKPVVSDQGLNEPEDDRLAWICWGRNWNGLKLCNAGLLGEVILGK